MGSSSSPLQQAHIVLRPSGANMLQIPKLDRGGTMVSRRKFLGFTGLAAAWTNAAWTQDEKLKAKPKPKPEGVLVNDVHAQLNSTRVFRIVEPTSVEAVRGAMKLARTEKRALCIAGGRHAMGTQQFATDGVLLDIRKMNKVLAFDTSAGRLRWGPGCNCRRRSST